MKKKRKGSRRTRTRRNADDAIECLTDWKIVYELFQHWGLETVATSFVFATDYFLGYLIFWLEMFDCRKFTPK